MKPGQPIAAPPLTATDPPLPVSGRRPVAALRIAHFSDSYLPRRDGVVTSLRTLAAAQLDEGHRILCAVPRHPRQQPAENLLRLRSVPGGPARIRLAGWPREAQVARVRRFGPDVVHVHTPGPAGLLGILAARRLGVPLVYTYHTNLHAGVELYRMPSWLLAVGIRAYARRLGVRRPCLPGGADRRDELVDVLLGLLLADAGAVLVPSAAVLARRPLPVPADRLHVVPTAVAAAPGSDVDGAGFRRRHGIGPAAPVILFVGRVHQEKNVGLALDAYALLRRDVPSARLVLIGAVDRPRRTRRLLAAAGVADSAVLTGELPPSEVAAGYAAADVLAVPSLYETQGLVLAEAARWSVPAVLADPVLAAADPLTSTALLAPANPAGYARAVRELLTDPAQRAARGAAARRAVERASTADYAAQVLAVYRALPPTHPGPAPDSAPTSGAPADIGPGVVPGGGGSATVPADRALPARRAGFWAGAVGEARPGGRL